MFDEDESDSLEIDELVALFIQNYVCPTMDEEDLKKQPQDVRDFVQIIRDFLYNEFAQIYAMVSDNESLTLEQFVTMCISQKCNSMLLESILKLREMRDLPIHASLVEKIGFVKNTPFNFEDMVKKLVYQKEVKEMREMVADSNVIEELMDLDYSRFSDKQKDAFKLILAIKEKTVEGFKDLPKGQQKEMLQRHAETYQKNTDVIKLLFEFQTSNFQHLLDIYQKSCDVHANSVSKYEMIYQLNKRNIITSDTLEENKGGQKEQFYKDYFQRVTDEKEHSELSGFPYQKEKPETSTTAGGATTRTAFYSRGRLASTTNLAEQYENSEECAIMKLTVDAWLIQKKLKKYLIEGVQKAKEEVKQYTEREQRKKSFRVLTGRPQTYANKVSQATLYSPLASNNPRMFDRTRSGPDLVRPFS